jgi:hypothetical protein
MSEEELDEAPVEPIADDEEQRRLRHIERIHGRVLLVDCLLLAARQDGAEAWARILDGIRDGTLSALAEVDGRTVDLKPEWARFWVPFDANVGIRLDGGGSIRFASDRPGARELGVPSIASYISFKYEEIEEKWRLAAQHYWSNWRCKLRHLPQSASGRDLARKVTHHGHALLHEAVELIDEWERADQTWARNGSPLGWQTIKRGIRVGNLKPLTDDGQEPFDPRWIDFILPKDGKDYLAEGLGCIWFDIVQAKKHLGKIPQRVPPVHFDVEELERIWPGCTGVAQPPNRSIVVRQSLSRDPTTAEQPTAGDVALPQAKSVPNAPGGRPSDTPVVHEILMEIYKEDPRNKHMNPGELAHLISKRLPGGKSIGHETIVRKIGEIRGTRKPPEKSKKH